ncbi:MAG: hypothetical protein IJU91_06090 [Selenomonadaceae bacterium]|nr:hypothetical protein [Selenomonadaceae bacterium]
MAEWSPANYDPALPVELWKKLLKDRDIFSVSDLEIMKRFLEFGLDFFSLNEAEDKICKATLENLVLAYGETYEFYQKHIDSLGKRIADTTRCHVYHADGKYHYENILLVERETKSCAKIHNPDDKMYKLRDELIAALYTVNFSNIKLYSDEKIFEKINLESETTADRKKINNTLATLQYVFVDSNGSIPIKTKSASDDDKNYFVINAVERDNYKVGNLIRIVDKVAVALLARGFAYKISESKIDAIKRDVKVGKAATDYFNITKERVAEIKASIMI